MTFDSARIDWLELRPDLMEAGRLILREHGAYMVSDDPAIEQLAEVIGWDGITSSTRTAIENAVWAGMFERCAAGLGLASGEGLIVEGDTFREAQAGETPDWVMP